MAAAQTSCRAFKVAGMHLNQAKDSVCLWSRLASTPEVKGYLLELLHFVQTLQEVRNGI